MRSLADDLDSLSVLVEQAAEHFQIPVAFVEKDFWAIEILRSATSGRLVTDRDGSIQEMKMIFKGGTSLSRVFQLIDRFSDDIDLLVVFPDECSKNARDKVLKQIAKDVQAHLGIGDEFCKLRDATTGVKRNVRFHYPARQDQAGNSNGVLLEMGIRGGNQPSSRHEIHSLLATYAIEKLGESESTWAEFAAFSVLVLGPERTLFEKLALFHSAATDIDQERARKALAQSGRHLYDIHQLLHSVDLLTTLREMEREGVAKLCVDIRQKSIDAEFASTERPSEGYAFSSAFQPEFELREIMQTSYDLACRELIYGATPTFDECIVTILECAAYL